MIEPNLPSARSELDEKDPNALQAIASNPQASVWVGASAGTGKTKVLTDRVLRLLLPSGPNADATSPHKILCLTFTKAGAGEMALRLSSILSRWVILADDELKEALQSLTGAVVSDATLAAARKLFSEVTDTPGGIKILTIHSFCQSVLGRFPLEADLNPHFTLMDDQEAALYLRRAQNSVLLKSSREKASPLSHAISHLSEVLSEDVFSALLNSALSERQYLNTMKRRYPDADGFYTHLCQILDIQPGLSKDAYCAQQCEDKNINKAGLSEVAEIMRTSKSATDQDRSLTIFHMLENDAPARAENFDVYKRVFLTKDNTVRSKLATKEVLKKLPAAEDVLLEEAARLLDIHDTLCRIHAAESTRDIILVCSAILQEYTKLKDDSGRLDYDDLILKTLALLKPHNDTGSATSWVHYKLDDGIDHILIDEAQDTNPEQWRIIEALCDEFFSGHGTKDINRTVFTVGDEKQSIYSFQRASPHDFFRMKALFKDRILSAGQAWQDVPMDTSFRSTQSVLKAVDLTFSPMQLQAALSTRSVAHSYKRDGQAGHVELWPVFEDDLQEKRDLWDIAIPAHDNRPEAASALAKMSAAIAQRIKYWLDNGEILPSHGRKIEPKDIMILVRTRSKMVRQISKALKDYNIPVGGLDRIILNDQIIVQDMLALADFVLQPQDDLALASFLKSPFIGLDEDDLFTFAYDRGEYSLWEAMQDRASSALITYLQDFIVSGGILTPYAFFTRLLQNKIPGGDHSGRAAALARLGIDAEEAIDEFLNQALDFDYNDTASLQEFTFQQRNKIVEIKREQETTLNAVRIMTVHGSKGLQAPIVFLPDTTANTKSAPFTAAKRLLWPARTQLDIPLWSARKDIDCSVYQDAAEHHHALAHQEYLRLLYVAMTRAEDRLYICGAQGKSLPEDCWYQYIKSGLINHASTITDETGALILANPQTAAAPDRTTAQHTKNWDAAEVPAWAYTAYEGTAQRHAIIQPSQYAHEEVASPLSQLTSARMRRGSVIHRLLQFLPDLAPEQRQSAAHDYIRQFARDLDERQTSALIFEVLQVLDHPEFSALFTKDAQAEVPVSGYIEGKGLISGQIDRLAVTADGVYILDYKTNKAAPGNPGDMPKAYKEQLQLYAALVSRIYPDKPIRAALLWTDGPLFMPLDLQAG